MHRLSDAPGDGAVCRDAYDQSALAGEKSHCRASAPRDGACGAQCSGPAGKSRGELAAAADDPNRKLLPRDDGAVRAHAVPGENLRYRDLEELGDLGKRVATSDRIGNAAGGI